MTSNSRILRTGVVGAGVFGGFHASKYAANDRVELVGVYEPDLERARALAEKHGAKGFDNFADFLSGVDAITVASPAVHHFEAAATALALGKHVLVEKPIASSVEEARELIALASRHGCVLQVGHQERFVFNAMGLFAVGATPKKITASRMGPPSERCLDVSVTLDLMIHDLDLVIALSGSAVKSVTGEVDKGRFGHPDVARAKLVFDNGCEADLTASRVHHERDRKMRVEYETGVLDIDFVAKTFENSTPTISIPTSPMTRPPGIPSGPMSLPSLPRSSMAPRSPCRELPACGRWTPPGRSTGPGPMAPDPLAGTSGAV